MEQNGFTRVQWCRLFHLSKKQNSTSYKTQPSTLRRQEAGWSKNQIHTSLKGTFAEIQNPWFPHSQSFIIHVKYCQPSQLPAKWIFHFLLIRACRSSSYIPAYVQRDIKMRECRWGHHETLMLSVKNIPACSGVLMQRKVQNTLSACAACLFQNLPAAEPKVQTRQQHFSNLFKTLPERVTKQQWSPPPHEEILRLWFCEALRWKWMWLFRACRLNIEERMTGCLMDAVKHACMCQPDGWEHSADRTASLFRQDSC